MRIVHFYIFVIMRCPGLARRNACCFAFLMIAMWVTFTTEVRCQDSTLHHLNNKERLDYAREHKFPTPRTIVKDSTGKILKNINLQLPVVDGELFSASDFYTDPSGKIVEVVIRKPRSTDRDLIKKLYDIDEEELRGSMEPLKADCGRARDLLAEVFVKEQENRKDEQVIDAEIDNTQEAIVVGILKQCGVPTLASVGVDGVHAVFLVLQHARRKNQEKYYPVLEAFLKNGNIRKGAAASIEDRLLMTSGQKQKYGTQIVFFVRTGYHLFPVEDPEHVDARRAAIGLPPLEQYLKDREEFYGSEIR